DAASQMFNNTQLAQPAQHPKADTSSGLGGGVVMEVQSLELPAGEEAVLVEAGQDSPVAVAQLPLDEPQLPAAHPPGAALGSTGGSRRRQTFGRLTRAGTARHVGR